MGFFLADCLLSIKFCYKISYFSQLKYKVRKKMTALFFICIPFFCMLSLVAIQWFFSSQSVVESCYFGISSPAFAVLFVEGRGKLHSGCAGQRSLYLCLCVRICLVQARSGVQCSFVGVCQFRALVEILQGTLHRAVLVCHLHCTHSKCSVSFEVLFLICFVPAYLLVQPTSFTMCKVFQHILRRSYVCVRVKICPVCGSIVLFIVRSIWLTVSTSHTLYCVALAGCS